MKNMQIRGARSDQFLREPDIRIGRSQFDRSHGVKTTFDASYLIPILVDEVLPGDTATCRLNGFCRIFSPLDAPIMDNITLETFFFFVPTRLVWSNFKYFMGEHDSPGAQDTDYTIPILDSGMTVSHQEGTGDEHLAAYFGIPHGLQSGSVDVNALPFRAYNLIYREFFRDQNIAGYPTVATSDGPDAVTLYEIKKSAKKHDYFTTCLPYLQKGDPVTVALSGTAPIEGIGVADQVPSQTTTNVYETDGTGTEQYPFSWTSTEIHVEGDAASGDFPMIYANVSGLYFEINDLRESVAIQRLLELDARGGTRLTEIIQSQFGVRPPDYRLQRPEFLGGGKSFINVSPVANTSGVDSTVSISGSDEPQGLLRGVGSGSLTGHGWAKSFVEPGYIIGLVRARGDLSYFQGLDKMWSRQTRLEFYTPVLANLGEQAVLNKELYVSNDSNDDLTFGYQERWGEYRFKKSMITGKFNPDVSGSLSHWHLAEDFGSLPTLNTTFIFDQTPMSRVTTVDSEPDFILDVWFDYKWARPIPVHSIPSLTQMRF